MEVIYMITIPYKSANIPAHAAISNLLFPPGWRTRAAPGSATLVVHQTCELIMRTLTLIRHAKSSREDSTLSDFERPLNKRGKNNAPLMGNLLKQQGVTFDLLVTSPALRALDTARLIAAAMQQPEQTLIEQPELYDAGVARLLEVVQRLPDSAAAVAVVAHNPGLTGLCNYLSGENIENLPTCAIASILFETDSWQAVGRDSGRLIRYEYPRKYTE
jgi:phosphohistidine phosphatase